MNITAEISLYPFSESYDTEILEFLEKISSGKGIAVETTAMSTLLTGNYETIMNLVRDELKFFFRNHKAVCMMKISNGCLVDES